MKTLHIAFMTMLCCLGSGIAASTSCAETAPSQSPARQEASPLDDQIYKAGEDAFRKKEYAEARRQLEIIINKYPFSQFYKPAIFRLGFSMFKTGSQEEGAKMLEKGLILQPLGEFSRDSARLLADYYYENNRWEEAKKHYNFLKENYGGSGMGDHVLSRSGKLKTRLGDFQGAIEDLERLVQDFPNSTHMNEALAALLELYNQVGSSSQGITLYETRRKRFLAIADDGKSLMAAATAYSMLALHEKVLEVVADFERLFPKSGLKAVALGKKGQALLAMRQYPEAEKVLKAALALNKQSPEVIVALASSYMEKERFGDAAALLRTLPTTPDDQINMRAALLEGNLLLKLKKNAEALRIYARAVQAAGRLDPANTLVKQMLPKVYMGIGDAQFAEKKYAAAIDAYGKSRELGAIKEDLYWGLYRTGSCWEKLGDNAKAVESYQTLASSSEDPFWVSRANSRIEDISFNTKLKEPAEKGDQ